MFDSILVVCTGNICRSPMAEAVLKDRLGSSRKRVESAGTAALVGYPADPLAQAVMQDHGQDIAEHRGRQVNALLLSAADLVFALDESHRRWMVEQFPQFRGRVFKLGKWRGDRDVADPYRLPREAFDRAYLDIVECVDDWVPHLLA